MALKPVISDSVWRQLGTPYLTPASFKLQVKKAGLKPYPSIGKVILP